MQSSMGVVTVEFRFEGVVLVEELVFKISYKKDWQS